jgi:polysaccharide chain length determinant protein (PEP-CTERM system associated)
MEDLLRHARLFLRGMWLHRWLGVLVAWVVGIVAAIAVFVTPDQYQASARIYVDTESVLKPLLSGLVVQANTDQQIAMLSRTLISRPNVEKLVRMADLDLRIKGAKDKEDLIDHVTKTLKIKSVGRDNLYTLEFRDPDPEKARKVVQSLTTIFVESSLGNKQTDTDSAKKFVDEQIKVYQKKLEEAEGRLKEFKLKNLELQLDGKDGSGGQISSLSQQLGQAKLELREAENARSVLKQQILGAENAAASSGIVAVPEIDSRIDAMQRKLDGLLQQFTDQHPDVKGTRRIIEDLEAQKKTELAARRKAAAANPAALLNSDSISQGVKASLANAEARAASLRTRVAEYESRYAAAAGRMKQLPAIEAEYAQLNRDYDINKKNYDGLVQRRESASISEGMAAVSGVADFRLIDPPRASPKPVAPDRLVLLAVAMVVSLVAGALGSFAASQVQPAFFDANSLRDVTGLPLLGIVSRQVTHALKTRERKDMIRVSIVVGALIGLFLVGMAVVFYFQAG